MKQSPLSGHLFVFRNRHRDRLEILCSDRDGLAIWHQRLEKGSLTLPTDLKPGDNDQASAEISIDELTWLLRGVELASVKRRKRYSRLNTPREQYFAWRKPHAFLARLTGRNPDELPMTAEELRALLIATREEANRSQRRAEIAEQKATFLLPTSFRVSPELC